MDEVDSMLVSGAASSTGTSGPYATPVGSYSGTAERRPDSLLGDVEGMLSVRGAKPTGKVQR